MFVHDFIRKSLLSQCPDVEPLGYLTLEDIKANRKQFDSFVEMMNNRMVQGYFRYGRNEPSEPARINYLKHIRQCVADYLETGNQEFLIDCANSCRLEFCFPTHPSSHFTPLDDQSHAENL